MKSVSPFLHSRVFFATLISFDAPSFLSLFTLFVVALEFSETERINAAEGIFMVYSLGFTLEKIAAMQEHGIKGAFSNQSRWPGADDRAKSTSRGHGCVAGCSRIRVSISSIDAPCRMVSIWHLVGIPSGSSHRGR